jgi:hypothetical protein
MTPTRKLVLVRVKDLLDIHSVQETRISIEHMYQVAQILEEQECNRIIQNAATLSWFFFKNQVQVKLHISPIWSHPKNLSYLMINLIILILTCI